MWLRTLEKSGVPLESIVPREEYYKSEAFPLFSFKCGGLREKPYLKWIGVIFHHYGNLKQPLTAYTSSVSILVNCSYLFQTNRKAHGKMEQFQAGRIRHL